MHLLLDECLAISAPVATAYTVTAACSAVACTARNAPIASAAHFAGSAFLVADFRLELIYHLTVACGGVIVLGVVHHADVGSSNHDAR